MDLLKYELPEEVAAAPMVSLLALFQSIEQTAKSTTEQAAIVRAIMAWNRYVMAAAPMFAFALTQLPKEAVVHAVDPLVKYVIDRRQTPFTKLPFHRFALAHQHSDLHLALYRWAKLRGFDQESTDFMARVILAPHNIDARDGNSL